MKQSVNNDIRYVRYVVSKYLRDKPELETFREDLEQEGILGLLQAREDYDPKKSTMDKALYLGYRIRQSLLDYLKRKEAKHFKSPRPESLLEDTPDTECDKYGYDINAAMAHESSAWDLSEHVEPDSLPKPEDTIDTLVLYDLLSKAEISPRQKEILKEYLQCGDYAQVASILGISRERVRRSVNRIVEKCRQGVDIS